MSGNLQKYMDDWQLDNPLRIASTPTSNVYVVEGADGGKAVLKLLTPLGKKDECGGVVALKCMGGQGAVRLLQHDNDAQLLEYAGGEDLKTLVRRGQDAEAAAVIGDVLNALHGAWQGAPPEGLMPLQARFCSLFYAAGRDGADPLYLRAAGVADRLLKDPRDPRVLHGDIHHENIRRSERGWLAIDPKGLYGEKTFDAANALCNPAGMHALVQDEARLMMNADVLSQKLCVERARLLAFLFAYAALSACWSVEDGQDPAHALAMARLAAPHAPAE